MDTRNGRQFIAGVGFFASATSMPIDWAWKAFGMENGIVSGKSFAPGDVGYQALREKVEGGLMSASQAMTLQSRRTRWRSQTWCRT